MMAYPNIVVVIADATNLRRSIFLLTQLIDLDINVVFALNMFDIAKKQGLSIKLPLLSTQLGIPIVAINARRRKGIDT